jgi:hypothetical protein
MDWKQVVATVAPWIGGALGGPLGGAAMTVIADTLGLSDATESAIKQAISGTTPEQMLALKNADQDFKLKMQELGFTNTKDMEALAVEDRSSARLREVTTGDKTARNLAYAITVGFFGTLTYLMVGSVSTESRDILNIMLGSLGTAWVGVNSYYFGSTKGSQAKTELLAKSEAIKD